MERAWELQVIAEEAKPRDHEERSVTTSQSSAPRENNRGRWLRIVIYTLFVLSGQAVATLLGRQYFDKGGNSKWLATLVQLVGFPILFLYYFFSPLSKHTTTNLDVKEPSPIIVGLVYVSTGLLVAGNCYLYSVGLLYLPVSTYSLICASQLAFNAFFSYFLNSQKFTPFIVNSLVLLTISSTLLVLNNETQNTTKVSKAKYAIGFICTVGASAGYGLVLSLTQLAFRKVLRKQTFSVVMDLIIYQSLVGTSVILVGLFASGEWKSLTGEMENYKMGKVSYVMNLVWTAIFWQVFAIGAVGLIFDVSSLFSNAISVLGLPIVPVAAVIFFHEKMDGLKVIAMVLAIWGFMSYAYQNHLDDKHLKIGDRNADRVPEATSTTRS